MLCMSGENILRVKPRETFNLARLSSVWLKPLKEVVLCTVKNLNSFVGVEIVRVSPNLAIKV